ncbi:hypothetical protein LSTR_LSTR010783 [Laodelphax striatellus]|nr:hypothetical protein LSTR_LSTR010783 [Laodelphax striatellus]
MNEKHGQELKGEHSFGFDKRNVRIHEKNSSKLDEMNCIKLDRHECNQGECYFRWDKHSLKWQEKQWGEFNQIDQEHNLEMQEKRYLKWDELNLHLQEWDKNVFKLQEQHNLKPHHYFNLEVEQNNLNLEQHDLELDSSNLELQNEHNLNLENKHNLNLEQHNLNLEQHNLNPEQYSLKRKHKMLSRSGKRFYTLNALLLLNCGTPPLELETEVNQEREDCEEEK